MEQDTEGILTFNDEGELVHKQWNDASVEFGNSIYSEDKCKMPDKPQKGATEETFNIWMEANLALQSNKSIAIHSYYEGIRFGVNWQKQYTLAPIPKEIDALVEEYRNQWKVDGKYDDRATEEMAYNASENWKQGYTEALKSIKKDLLDKNVLIGKLKVSLDNMRKLLKSK